MTTTGDDIPRYTCPKCGRTFPWDERIAHRPHLPTVCTCTECGEIERQEKAQREAEAARRHREAQWEKLCPPLYRQTAPERLPDQKALTEALSWSWGPSGLLMAGPTGSGKTRIAWLVLRRVFDEGKRIHAFDAVSFSHEVGNRFYDGDGEGWIARVARADVLFLDDVGKCKLTERGEAELFGLVEKRTANLLPIVCTMNLTDAALQDRLSEDRGAPLVRRLKEFCKVLVVGARAGAGQ